MTGCNHEYVVVNGRFICTKCSHEHVTRHQAQVLQDPPKRRRWVIMPILVTVFMALIVLSVTPSDRGTAVPDMNGVTIGEPAVEPEPEPKYSTGTQESDIDWTLSETTAKPKTGIIFGDGTKITDTPDDWHSHDRRHQLDIRKLERLIHDKVNEQRDAHGLTALVYDDTIATIAGDHSMDMAMNDYFEHTSLDGREPWDRGYPGGYDSCGTSEALELSAAYDELAAQYDRFPSMVSGQAEFDFAQGMVNRLNAMSDELNLLSERKEYFAGLAENIFQTWTYGSTTHFAGTVSYNWISEEEMASQIVDGWMDSPGHRENILSGFHSQGIGVYATPEGKAYATQNLC